MTGVTVITVSTSAAAGEAPDLSGPKLVELVEGWLRASIETGRERADAEEAERAQANAGDSGIHVNLLTVTDDRAAISAALRGEIEVGTGLVLTTGGTGFSADDVTPEATRDVIDREAPGLAEAIRADAAVRIRTGILTRGVAGIAGGTLIVNLPGSPKAVVESFAVLEPVLGHALAQIGSRGGRTDH